GEGPRAPRPRPARRRAVRAGAGDRAGGPATAPGPAAFPAGGGGGGAAPGPTAPRRRGEAPRGRRPRPRTCVVGSARERRAPVAAGATGLMVGGRSTAFCFRLTGLALGLRFHVIGGATFTYVLFDDRIELRRALIGRS